MHFETAWILTSEIQYIQMYEIHHIKIAFVSIKTHYNIRVKQGSSSKDMVNTSQIVVKKTYVAHWYCHTLSFLSASFLPCCRLWSRCWFLAENSGRRKLLTPFRHVATLILYKLMAACGNLLAPTLLCSLTFVQHFLVWVGMLKISITHPSLLSN